MKPIRTFAVIPKLPPPIEALRKLAHNLRWAWDHRTVQLFRRLDSELWESTGHNPVLMLGKIDQSRLQNAATDPAFLAHLEKVEKSFDAYLSGEGAWFARRHGKKDVPLVAYFSAEFGLTESLSIFAGGLGILAGDHLKSASDLGVPLVGVGLLYQQASFKQRLNGAAWQQEVFEDNDFSNLPLTVEKEPGGNPVIVTVPMAGHAVHAQIWRVQVGRVPLYLLDTNIARNERMEDRAITAQLYGGDSETRIRQELVLGLGGNRALEALGLCPTVYHMNEGHSAFLGLERVRRLMEQQGLSFRESFEEASASLIFTTHTPVEAGHDYFTPGLMERYLGDYFKFFGISWDEFLGLGRRNPLNPNEEFCMTALALRLASFRNGVSALHGEVSRQMWKDLWPGVPIAEVPIGHVTNGVHFSSWISQELHQLYDRYLGPRWREEPADRAVWQHADGIPSEELWRSHERRRERLVGFSRRRLVRQLKRRGSPAAEITAAEEALDSRILTIGFARRFATYKRANLFLRDPDRLERILKNTERPVQIILAGKAHPHDDAGKELIRKIVSLIRERNLRSRLVFLEDYDMTVARYLVQGADIWLNTPLRPLEACGTSGMKAAANGVMNVSTLDGWWAEAWGPDIHGGPLSPGWAIGRGEIFENRDYQDQVEADAFYGLLEGDLVPAFYDRKADGLPRLWLARMKAAISSLCPVYTTHRMVCEYTENYYLNAHARHLQLAAADAAQARQLAAWKERVRACWPNIRIESVETKASGEVVVGSELTSRVKVRLGALSPDEVAVELYAGKLDAHENFTHAVATLMRAIAREGDLHVFETSYGPCSESGLHGYTIRVKPFHRESNTESVPGCITWAG
ncbi:MAG: alpha-glucan family phosphorylase [Bryobacteraceae bacterium]